MASISLRRPHSLCPTDVRRRAEAVARRIELRHQVSWRWEGDHLRLTAPTGIARGASGTVTVRDDHVAIEIDLPLPLRPVKGLVEGQLRQRLDALLAPA
jgi:putative polyhydroxyalkanoate system protein